MTWRLLRALLLGAVTATIAAAAPARAVVVLVDQTSSELVKSVPAAAAAVLISPFVIALIAWVLVRRLTGPDRAAIRVGYFVGVVIFLLVLLNPVDGGWRDARAYYTLGISDPYGLAYSAGGVLYAPPFFQLIEPLRRLDWSVFLFIWSAAQLAALWIVAGPLAAVLLVVPLVALEAWFANINILLALAITLGFRWPALWSAVLLTKVTPGVGLVWFLVRREWRNLAIALGATIAICVVSLGLAPELWTSWFKALTSSAPPDRVADFVPLPVRVAVAALIVAWGGLTDRPWTVPLGATIALPVLWPAALSILVAMIPLSRSSSPLFRRRAADRAVATGRSAGTAAPGRDGVGGGAWPASLARLRLRRNTPG